MIRDHTGDSLIAATSAQPEHDAAREDRRCGLAESLPQATLDALSAHIAVLDEDGGIIAVNRAWHAFAEANPPLTSNVNEGASYLAVCDAATGADADEAAAVAAGIRAVIRGDENTVEMEYPCHSPNTKRWFVCRVSRFPGTGISRVVVAHENITARKQAETYREMGRDVLQALNAPGDLQNAIQHVLAIVKNRTGVDAVGIRLQSGEDFPYFSQDGFSPDFLATENTLVERGKDGGVCRDEDGHARLECTCGLVLSGKTDPSQPFFTKGGSYWTNDSFPLLDLSPDEDPRHHPRNQCIHQGYASVALVPIREKDRIVGLLHLNDRRKGRFTLETIELLEGIAAHIGEALLRKQAEQMLRESEDRFRSYVENAPDGVFIVDEKGRYIEVNNAACRMTGYSKQEFEHLSVNDLVAEESAAAGLAHFETLTKTGAATSDLWLKKKDGSAFCVALSAVKLSATRFIGFKKDITARKLVEEKLRESEKRFRTLSEHSPIGISLVRPDMTYAYVNPFFTQMFGYSVADVGDRQTWYEKAYPDPVYRERVRKAWLADFAERDGFWRMQQETLTVRCKDGTDKIIRVNGAVLPDNQVLMTHEDVTQLAAAQNALEHLAMHDPLTGLFNRRAIRERLAQEISRAKREDGRVSVGMLDIDHFKSVNDTHGHQVGDEVLIAFSKRIQSPLRDYDCLGRYGGEEFLVITAAPRTQIEGNLYERLRATVADAPIPTKAGPIAVTVSIGVARGTGASTVDDLIAAADIALYQAKADGRNRVVDQ